MIFRKLVRHKRPKLLALCIVLQAGQLLDQRLKKTTEPP